MRTIVCIDCDEEVERTGNKQKRCKPCAEVATVVRNAGYEVTPEVKAGRAARRREQAAKPEYKAAAAVRRAKPEVKAAQKASGIKWRAKPEVKAALKTMRAKPEVKAAQAIYQAAHLAKPGNLEKRKARGAAWYAKPENRAAIRARGVVWYAKPENKAALKARSARPEVRAAEYVRRRSEKNRHAVLVSHMRKEDVAPTDPLYIFEKYQEKISCGCFYSGRLLSEVGHGLDRIDNLKDHTWDNTVACCQELNKMANRHRSYEWKVAEGKKMRAYDEFIRTQEPAVGRLHGHRAQILSSG